MQSNGRNVTEQFHQLEKQCRGARRLGELFRPKANQMRQELKTQCEQLLFSETVDYGRKVEELMWRCVYHDLMQCYKKLKTVGAGFHR